MASRAFSLAVLVPVAAGVSACSWSRFDDVQDKPPVVLLKRPDKMKSGFGVTIAAIATEEDGARVLIGGTSGKAPAGAFTLGTGTDPGVDAVDTGSCLPGDNVTCYLADRVAGLAVSDTGGSDPGQLCFVLGVGKSEIAPEYGLVARCADGTEYTLPVPPDVLTRVIKNEVIFQDQAVPLVLAADKDLGAALAAGAKDQKVAWYYGPASNTPIQLVAPGAADDGYGAAVAVARLNAGGDTGATKRLVAVGAPDAGHVWLFDGQDGKPVGCLGGPSQMGRTLGAGRVDTDDVDDLVVLDATNVTVISGAALAGLAPAADITCSLAALPPGAIIASFGCGSRDSTAGCADSNFGVVVDVGDLDGDGDGEVIVGAPEMKVRGAKRAGAVLVYDAEGARPWLLTDQLFLAGAEENDKLGGALAAAHIHGRDVVVAGAPGKGRAAVFYCSTLLARGEGGGRCD